MYTQCPECHTIFRVHEDQLAAAGGKVRCGHCMHVFQAPDHQVDRLPEEAEGPSEEESPGIASEEAPADLEARPADTGSTGAPGTFETGETEPLEELETFEATEPEPEYEPEPATEPEPSQAAGTPPSGPLDEELDESRIETLLSGDEPPEPEPEAPAPAPPAPPTPQPDSGLAGAAPADSSETRDGPPEDPVPADADDHLVEELRETSTRRHSGVGATVVWSLLILLLVAGLLGQYGYMNRDELAREPALRPWLERLCQLAKCELPPRRDLAAIEVFDPQIQSHPRYRDALLISATLTNGAGFAQPYPVVEVVLKDLGGNRVAWRRFAPEDYLVQSDHGRFPAGSEAHLLLEVTDPGDAAVGFEFNIVDGDR